MKIKSKLTGLTQTVTKAEWEKMIKLGTASKFDIIKNTPAPSAPPSDTASADYGAILKEATKLFKVKDYQKALAEYEKAAAIKSTPMIEGKIADCKEALKED